MRSQPSQIGLVFWPNVRLTLGNARVRRGGRALCGFWMELPTRVHSLMCWPKPEFPDWFSVWIVSPLVNVGFNVPPLSVLLSFSPFTSVNICITFLGVARLGTSVQFGCSVVSNSLRPHGLQHAITSCPSPAPGACSDSCPSSR